VSDGLTLKVQRVDQPRVNLLALGLYGGGERRVLLLHAAARSVAFGVVCERPRGLPADSRVRQLRKRLVGARLGSIQASQGWLLVRFARADEEILLQVTASDRVSEFFRLTPSEPTGPEFTRVGAESLYDASIMAQGASLLAGVTDGEFELRRVAIGRQLRRLRKRLSARKRAIEGDLQRMLAAPALRADAQLMLSNQHLVERGQISLTALDYTADPPCDRTVRLDPRSTPQAQAERLFHRARRLERGRPIAAARLEDTQAELSSVEQKERSLAGVQDLGDLDELARDLGGDRERPGDGSTRDQAKRLPYRRYLASGGRTVLVGRGARDNDSLTLQHAHPWDLWLHARGVEGAHVIVPRERDEACPAELLLDAATLAAHHSKARGQDTVDVQYVERRHVRKPRGFPAGAVRVEREKVLRLRVEPARLARLLKSSK